MQGFTHGNEKYWKESGNRKCRIYAGHEICTEGMWQDYLKKKTGLNYRGRCSGCSGGTRSEAQDSVRNWEGKRKG